MPYTLVENIKIVNTHPKGSTVVQKGDLYYFADIDGTRRLLAPVQNTVAFGTPNFYGDVLVWIEDGFAHIFDIKTKDLQQHKTPGTIRNLEYVDSRLYFTFGISGKKVSQVYIFDGKWRFMFEYLHSYVVRKDAKIVTYVNENVDRNTGYVMSIATGKVLLAVDLQHGVPFSCKLQPNGDLMMPDGTVYSGASLCHNCNGKSAHPYGEKHECEVCGITYLVPEDVTTAGGIPSSN
jgi:hypothetical protein